MNDSLRIPEASRRSVLRTAGLLGLAAVPGTALLSGCATAGGSGPKTSSGGATSGAAGAGPKADPNAPLDVVIFDGGYGKEFAQADVDLYRQKYPKANVALEPIQDIKTQMQPKFVAGNPPDVLDNSGANALPTATLVSNGQLADLAPLLSAPSVDDPGTTVADTLLAGALDGVKYNGKVMAIPYAYVGYGFYYSASLFKKKGWQWPTDWAGLLDLCTKIKAAGMAPFSYGGTTAPDYWARPLFNLAVKLGGKQTITDIDGLKANAWLADPMRQSAAAVADLAKKGYFLDGSAGLSHTQAQTAFVQGKAGIYASGSWLENEMKAITPEGFDMTFGNVPPLTADGAWPATALSTQPGETYVVPAQGKNLAGGLEYLRLMLGKSAAATFSEKTHTPTIVKGAAEGQSFGSTAFASLNAAIAAAGANTFTYRFGGWYPTMSKELKTQMGNLLAGRVDGPGFLKAMQAAADKVAADSSIPKHTV